MIRNFLLSRLFLVVIIITCLAALGVAWYYQYQLGYGPCVLCIHIRMAIMLVIAIALLGLVLPKSKLSLSFVFATMAASAVWMFERSFKTLSVERGWAEGACTMDLGLPAWLPVDQWLPTLFEAWEPCGYTPYVFDSQVTMAEALVAASGLLTLVTFACLACATVFKRRGDIISLKPGR
ncbi:MAG: disulfide bond formation protein B [Pontibacterium sp.]